MASDGIEEYSLSYRHRFALVIERNKAKNSAAAKAKAESAKAQGLTNTRKCSYCEVTGHTRAKCATLIGDKASVLDLETRFRNSFALWLQNGGIGIGTMFERVTEWEDNKHVVMVMKATDFSTVTLNNVTADSTISGVFMNREGWENHLVDYSIPSGTGYPFADYGYKVIAPAPIPFTVAENHLSADNIKAFVYSMFDEKAKREYRWRRGKGHIGCFNTTRPNVTHMIATVESMESAAVAAQQNAAA
jgi:sarcosine oxidase delta subunit